MDSLIFRGFWPCCAIFAAVQLPALESAGVSIPNLMNLTSTAVCASIFISSIAFAQAPADPAAGGFTGGSGRPGGQQLSQRLLQGDANGDGKLSVEELPPQFHEVFAVVDTNKDGFLDEAEIAALVKTQGEGFGESRGEGRGAARGGRGGAGGAPQNYGGAMKQINRGFKGLKSSAFDSTTLAKDLEQIQNVQAGLVAAKGMASTVRMAPQAKAKYGDDNAKYQRDLRTQLIAALTTAIALESAVLAGDQAAAKAAVAKLDHAEDTGHEAFAAEEDEKPAQKPAEKPAEKPASLPATPSTPGGAK